MENIKGKKSILSIRFSQIIMCFGIFVLTFIGLIFMIKTIWKGIIIFILMIPFIVVIILLEFYLNYFVITNVDFINNKIIFTYKYRTLELKIDNIVRREESIIQGVRGNRYITNYDNRFILFEKKGHILTQYFDDDICNFINKKYNMYHNKSNVWE